MMMRRGQELSSGDHARNAQAGRDAFQAGHDIVQGDVYQFGLTYDQARQLTLDVFEANFLRMVGAAGDLVRDRVEHFIREYLDKLQVVNPSALSGVQDPDILKSIYVAQEGFARSGEGDLEKVLIDLLVDRTQQQDRELKALVLNEAIAALPKLSIRQLKSIAAAFVLRYTRRKKLTPLPDYYAYLTRALAPFVGMISDRRADYEHIQSTGVGALSVLEWELNQTLAAGARGFFTNGFEVDAVPDELRQYLSDDQVFIQCIRDSSKIQVNAVAAEDVSAIAISKNLDPGQLEQLAVNGVIGAAEIQEDLIAHVPEMHICFGLWNDPNSAVRRFELTSAGKAIGHSYWQHATGDTLSPLDIWLLFLAASANSAHSPQPGSSPHLGSGQVRRRGGA
jgi:hypothetical protein